MNRTPPIHSETLDNGDVFVIGDKPRIEHANGDITGLCLDLRCWYDKKNGFVTRKVRTDQQVIELSRSWLERTLKRGDQ